MMNTFNKGNSLRIKKQKALVKGSNKQDNQYIQAFLKVLQEYLLNLIKVLKNQVLKVI